LYTKMFGRLCVLFGYVVFLIVLDASSVFAQVAINEIHYDPDVKTEPVEFVELYNAGASAVDLSGYDFAGGIDYTFPSGSAIAAGGYVVVAQDVAAIASKFGVSAYGPFDGKLNNDGEDVVLSDATGAVADTVEYGCGFPWPTGCRGDGTSMELVNPNYDNDMGGYWRSGGPTPGAKNDSYVTSIPPCIRQVEHTPEQPVAGQAVTISAKVTDPDGVSSVVLKYQLVNPGSYIRKSDSAYSSSWTNLTMHDDGLNGDVTGGDDIYSVQMPASLQTNRRLIRYRIYTKDSTNNALTVPYSDDDQPNFAYFVYDGVPAWSGAANPGTTSVVDYSAATMQSVPVYQLIADATDVSNCQYDGGYQNTEFEGTLVYDGKVYDHIQYMIKGQYSTYQTGKNKWKFHFNTGHDFQARDNFGKKYKRSWSTLIFSTGTDPWWAWNWSVDGMILNEAVGMRFFQLAGVPASNTNFVHYRVIDDALESGATQYDGDFWGLYIAIEQPDGRFLDEHGLEDGNTFKIAGSGDWLGDSHLLNQGPTQSSDLSDLSAFISSTTGYNRTSPSYQPLSWWQTNVNLDRYYSYSAISTLINNADQRPENNCVYYLDPETNIWSMLPWDLDLTFEYGAHYTDREHWSYVLNYEEASIMCKNRNRELQDLLFDGEQASQVIEEYASVIDQSDTAPFVEASRDMWDYNPRTNKQGIYYREALLPTADFDGVVAYMKQYVTAIGYGASWGGGKLSGDAEDANIPDTPTVTATCSAEYPINRLTFSVDSFSDPNGNGTFDALQWRIGEVRAGSAIPEVPTSVSTADVTKKGPYEVETVWQSDDIAPFQSAVAIPSANLKVGHTYRVRARTMDTTGRASHWSGPIQFVAGEADNAAALVDSLRITELMYDPTLDDTYEYIELHNADTSLSLDLGSVTFTSGITYTIPSGTTLAPDEYLLVVKADSTGDFNAFRTAYGIASSVRIVGPYTGSLNNGGELLELKTAAGGTKIVAFEYDNARGWPLAPQHGGHSLVPLESAQALSSSGSLYYGGNWRASRNIGGSPGSDDPALLEDVTLNELAAGTANDWVELYNPTSHAISLAGYYLGNDVTNPAQLALPSGTSIPAGGYVSFDKTNHFNTSTTGFSLDKTGGDLVLSYLPTSGKTRIVDSVRYKAQENGISLGRHADGTGFWQTVTPSRNASNSGPIGNLVVSEIMYHPTDDLVGHEYIEISNPTDAAISLETAAGAWRIAGDVDFVFPSGTSIPAGGIVLVVGFDPSNATDLSGFKSLYGVTGSVTAYGPYTGSLSNRVGRVALEKPQSGTEVSWGIVDEAIFFEQSPFPTEPDGDGRSLVRVSNTGAGNDPSNWVAAIPSPGVLGNVLKTDNNWNRYR
jgi:hypothetical protein